MRRHRTTSLAAAALAVVWSISFAAPASADGDWHQAFGRSSAAQLCSPPPFETPWQDSFTGQREWTPSWEGWMNAGTGGWVCQRTIVWASLPAPAPTGPGCQFVRLAPGRSQYAQFGTSNTLRSGPVYNESTCTTTEIGAWSFLLYAPNVTQPTAAALCIAAFGIGLGADNHLTNRDIWDCNAA